MCACNFLMIELVRVSEFDNVFYRSIFPTNWPQTVPEVSMRLRGGKQSMFFVLLTFRSLNAQSIHYLKERLLLPLT